MINTLMQMESQEGNCLCFHHWLPFEREYAHQNCSMLCYRK